MKDWKQLWNFIQQFRLATSFASKTNKWPILAASWSPLDDWKLNFVTKPRRRRGRPSCRWDDRLSNFAECRLKSSWPEAAKRRQQWVAEEQFFLNFCRPSSVLPVFFPGGSVRFLKNTIFQKSSKQWVRVPGHDMVPGKKLSYQKRPRIIFLKAS